MYIYDKDDNNAADDSNNDKYDNNDNDDNDDGSLFARSCYPFIYPCINGKIKS